MLERNLNLLDPVVEERYRTLMRECDRVGILLHTVETRRNAITQRAYYAQGRENLSKVNAYRGLAGLWTITEKQNSRIITKTLESIHFYDCAADFAIIQPDGSLTWNTKADLNDNDLSDYAEVGTIAEMLGFTWGGKWKFKDICHVQYTGGLTLKDLRAGMRPSWRN